MFTKVIDADDASIKQLAGFLNKYFHYEMGAFTDSSLSGNVLYEKAKAMDLLVVVDGYPRLTEKGKGLIIIRGVPLSRQESENAKAKEAERRSGEILIPEHPLFRFLVTHCHPLQGSCDVRRVEDDEEYKRSLHEGLVRELNGRVLLTSEGMDVVLDQDGFFKVFHDVLDVQVKEQAVKRHDYYETAKCKGLAVLERSDEGNIVRLTEAGQALMNDLFYFDRRNKG
jgi:hypothetical protein